MLMSRITGIDEGQVQVRIVEDGHVELLWRTRKKVLEDGVYPWGPWITVLEYRYGCS